ncbi:MAG: TetR/AcrR family transcriptional regulator [Pseudolysinimonas sp.]
MVSYKQAPEQQPRRRRARNSLTRPEIVVAAREVLKDGGIGAFTIRAVADRLGASAMSLYNHVESKEDVLDAALDSLLLELRLSDDPARPAADVLVEYAEQHLAHLQANRWAIPALFRRPDPGPGAALVGEAYFATALRGGADPQTAVDIFTGVIAIIYGAAGFLGSEGDSQQTREEIAETIAQVPLPATASVAEPLAAYGDDAQVHRILTALIHGLLPRQPGVAPRT